MGMIQFWRERLVHAVSGMVFRGLSRADGVVGSTRISVFLSVCAVLAMVAPRALCQTIYEAENATLSGPLVASANAGYSGTGYADYSNVSGEFVEFSLNAYSAGAYPIAFRYANGGGADRPLSLKVNGTTVVASLGFPATAGWAAWGFTATNTVTLNAGVNTVRITDIGSNGPNVDYLLVAASGTGPLAANATNAPLRRPASASQPILMVHVDSWNAADPQKIMDLIPQDIRPYVVMNLSLSIYHETNKWLQVEYGYETAKSWLRTCAENGMWAMIQPSSGGYSHLSDFDRSVYEEFFREYPNFLGISYAEQFWGFDDVYAGSVPWTTRVAHWTELMKLNQKYGGYLMVSWCGNPWDANINPLAMMKRNPAFAAICKQSPQYFIICEKYTQQSYQSDMESVCLGDFLAGYAGHYGIRYDSTGWSDVNGTNGNFTLATGGAPMIEHMMLTGETVIDGPELIWQQDIRNLSTGTTSDGYTTRRWELFQQYQKFVLDMFRKILDGTIRIPTRQEVISRTKVVVLNDVTSGNNDNLYSSPDTLFQGLYRMDVDGNYGNNKYFFKKTGRYPSIPTAYQLADSVASNLFTVKVNKSTYSTRWPGIANKTSELNALFPQEYTGDIYAGRHENGWVIYNPYKTNITASGSIPFKYNTCDHVDVTLPRYTSGVMKEYSNSVTVYLCNYDNSLDTSLKTSTISIAGSTVEPTYTWVDRGGYAAASVTKTWVDGVWTLMVQHNGSVDITVNCAGMGTGRLTSFTPATIVPPAAPPVAYTGPRQNEAEHFDYKSISQNLNYGTSSGVSNYTGLGYIKFGTSSSASVRDVVTVLRNGTYRIETRYSVTGANISTIGLYVNGTKVATPVFTQTASYSDWAVNKQNVALNAGANTIEFRANATGASSVYFDNFVLDPVMITDGIVVQENRTGFVSVDGTIGSAYPGYTGEGYAETIASVGAGINWSLDFDASSIKAVTFRYAGTNNSTADLIIGGVNVASKVQFPSTGSMTNWDHATVYVCVPAGSATVRLQSTSATGLPHMDCIRVIGGWAGTQPPAGLTAAGVSKSRINVSWLSSSNATSYTIKRSLASGGPYSVIASGVTTTNFNDTGLASGSTYYYVVAAVSGLVEGSESEEASATTSSGTIDMLGCTSGLYTVTSGSGVTAGTLDLDDRANVLVVGVYIDASGISCLTNLTSFGGVAPSGCIQTSGAGDRMFALYWKNPKTTAGQPLVIGANASANIGAGYFAVQLAGVDPNAVVARTGATTTSAGSVNLTSTVANAFVVSFYSANDAGLTLTPSAPLTRIGSTLNTINNSGSLAVATNVAAVAGTRSLVWSSSGTTAQQGVNGLAFAPVVSVEPSGPARLTNSYHAGILSLSWPAGEGWRLQVQTNSLTQGLGTNWMDVTDTSVSSTNVTILPGLGSAFYRLVYP